MKVETAAAAIDLAQGEKRQDWSVAASYGQRSDGRDDMFMLEVGIELPLFTANRQDRGIAARRAEYEAALATREDARREQAARIRTDIEIGRAECRERVCPVRVDLGGWRIIKKKNTTSHLIKSFTKYANRC